MSTLPEAASLGKRLSMWLALQVFLGLALVSVVVYVLISDHLHDRRLHALTEKRELVHHLIGEAVVDRDLIEFRHRLDDFLTGHRELALTIVNSDGSIFYDNENAPLNTVSLESIEFPVRDLASTSETAMATLSYSNEADDALLSRLAMTLGFVALLGALLVSRGVFWLVRRALRPVNDLTEQTLHLTASTLASRLDGSGQPSELQPLVTQFNRLLERLSTSYEQLEGFNADVAHELNTPLTTLITSSELALRKPEDVQSLKEVLGSNLEELHRMSDIIKDMLFLSRAQRGSRARRSQVMSLAGVAIEVVEYHEAALSDAGLNVRVTGDASGEFDLPLIKRAISNLLGNAARYARVHSTVEVQIEQPSEQEVSLCVINQGDAIASDHRHRLFDRFYRVDASRTQAGLHHGLGLSIVAGIARMHGGEPFVDSDNGHTRVGFSVMRLEQRDTDASDHPPTRRESAVMIHGNPGEAL